MTLPVRRGRLLVAALVAVLASAIAAPAAAHPFGPPQTVTVDGDADTVRVRWKVGGTDDLTLLGVALGVIDEDRVMLDGAVFYEEADAATLAAAPAFRDYLLEHVSVTTDGTACPGEATVTDALATDGVELSYACPGTAAEAAVTVSTLTDLHPAYRTLATGPAGQRAVYDVDDPTHDWTLAGPPAGSGTDTGRSAALQLGAVLGVVLLGALGGLLWIRRRGRRA